MYIYIYIHIYIYIFICNGINYTQKKSCVMVTICAPAHANIFMGKFEKLHIYPYLRNFSTFYCRFIDDTFFLWNGTEPELKNPTMKFEFTHSWTSITFLDAKVFKNENGKPCTTIHRKPSDRRNCLRYKSAHPKALKDSLLYCQALCIRRICSETSEVIKHLKDLKDAFINWRYESKILDHHFERAMRVDQKILFENKEKPST